MKQVVRFSLYFVGLFAIALGINLAILSDLGVSPVSAFTVPLSQVVHISLGIVTSICYSVFVLIEIAVLGKRFRLKNLLQVPFSIVFGFFVDFIGSLFSAITLPNYAVRFVVMMVGVVACAVGAVMYIAMDVVPNPPEGLILAFCERFDIPFGRLKIVTDCIFVTLGILLSVLFLGGVGDIREGTVISAILTGKIISWLTKRWQPVFKRLAFPREEKKQNT